MTTAPTRPGGQLFLPLRRLDPAELPVVSPAPAGGLGGRHLARDLEIVPSGALVQWAGTVRSADEACLLLDAGGRVVAMSPAAADLLELRPTALGASLVDVVTALDFTAAATPEADPERSLPPLRALGGVLARGLVRLRRADGALSPYDVVSVPLDDGAGSLSFLLMV